jgi:uncharacterized protein (DUF433 family)
MAKTTKERKVIRTEHPHIVKVDGVCGGLEIVEGRRVPVWAIANYWRMGMKAEEIAEELSLPLSHVFDALSYYLDHQADIDRQIEESQKLPEGFYVDEQGFVRRVEEKSR